MLLANSSSSQWPSFPKDESLGGKFGKSIQSKLKNTRDSKKFGLFLSLINGKQRKIRNRWHLVWIYLRGFVNDWENLTVVISLPNWFLPKSGQYSVKTKVSSVWAQIHKLYHTWGSYRTWETWKVMEFIVSISGLENHGIGHRKAICFWNIERQKDKKFEIRTDQSEIRLQFQ